MPKGPSPFDIISYVSSIIYYMEEVCTVTLMPIEFLSLSKAKKLQRK